MRAYDAATVNCQLAEVGQPHHAEVNEDGETFLHASHGGAWYWACARHSGLCHEECWSERSYPELRSRIAPGNRDGRER